MINSLKVSRHNHVQDVEMLNLSRINIICGRNNAGKTTILNTLSGGSDKYLLGKKYIFEEAWSFFEEVLADLKEELQGHYYWTDEILDLYYSVLHPALKGFNKSSYFVDDLLLITHEIYMSSSVQGLNEHIQKRINLIISEKSYFFPYLDDSEIIFIPTNRFIETRPRYDIQNKQIESNGEGIVNKIFYMKSQLEGSPELKAFHKMKEQFKFICDGGDFDIVTNSDGTISLMFTNPSGEWLGADNCGLGLRDLIIILYFANSHDNSKLILIDEVETHIHPDLQRKLLYILKEKSEKQFFITTHSNIFLDNTFVNKIFHVTFDGKIIIVDATSRSALLNDLGFSVSDNLTSDLIILCEGPSDKPILEEFLYKLNLMQNYNIKIWPLGGDIMDQHDLSVFSDSFNIIGLIDRDPGSEVIRKRFIENCNTNNIEVHRLERYAIENYFSIQALIVVFKGQISDSIKSIDPLMKLEDQIGLNPKKNNRKIANKMTIADIEGTDLYDFFDKVEKKLKSI